MKIFLDQNQRPIKKPKNQEITWRVSAYALIKKADKILMVKPVWNTLWELPGGKVEINEKITEGIERECLEETEHQVKVTSKLPIFIAESDFYSNINDEFHHSVILIYSAKIINSKLIKNTDQKEIAETQWVSLKNLNKKNCHAIFWPIINETKKYENRINA